MTGFPLHPILQGEKMDDILSGMQISDYYRASYMNSVQDMQFERDVSRDFTTGTSLVTLASNYDLYEIEPKLGTSGTVISYPSRVAEDIGENDYSALTQSIGNTGNTLNVGYEGVPIDLSTRWDFNEVANPPNLTGFITGSTAPQLTGNIPSDGGWMPSENAGLSSDSPPGSSSRFNNELSLTLATSHPSIFGLTGIQDQFVSHSSISDHSLKNQHLVHKETLCNLGDASSCLIYNRPAQISQFYSGSRYLNVMQEIFADFANFSLNHLNKMSSPAIGPFTGENGYELPNDTDPRGCSSMKHSSRDWDLECKKKQLLGLLRVVDEEYNRLVDEMYTIISAFHAVAELDPQTHARFALQTVSFFYKNLRERISNLILAMEAACVSSKGSPRDEKSFEMSFIQKQWALKQLKRKDQHLWRPQKGLPERSVSVLRAWMFQNFLHPYPKDAEKDLLAVKSGLTRGQVSNWFINARVRLWKPLIEEMYAEISRRNEGGSRKNGTIDHERYLSI
ncbi:homeodomain transcription factor [Lithospermum erythrorhizon]|uniref:Homeodomain transcription factor n=1 Tax=Lithospermum erythrorhizon TaxID=34254 RepID=A0AAV3RBF1_LITER